MKTVWYKEPWAWLIVILPLCAVVASIYTFFIATNKADSLVVGDYYKKGKAINQDISKVKRAQKLGIKFRLTQNDQEFVILPIGIEKQFPVLNLAFYHPTQADKDFSIKLTANANGEFRWHSKQPLTGKWRVTVTPFTQDWKIQNVVYFPLSSAVNLVPDITEAN